MKREGRQKPDLVSTIKEFVFFPNSSQLWSSLEYFSLNHNHLFVISSANNSVVEKGIGQVS